MCREKKHTSLNGMAKSVYQKVDPSPESERMSKHSISILLMTVGRVEAADLLPVFTFPVPDAEEDSPATEACNLSCWSCGPHYSSVYL